MCRKLGHRNCKALREAKRVEWENKGLTADELKLLGTLGSVLSGLALAGTCAKRPGTCAEWSGTCWHLRQAAWHLRRAAWHLRRAAWHLRRVVCGTCWHLRQAAWHLRRVLASLDASTHKRPVLDGSKVPVAAHSISRVQQRYSVCCVLHHKSQRLALPRNGVWNRARAVRLPAASGGSAYGAAQRWRPFNMRSANPAATVDMHALWEERTAYFQRTRGKEGVDLLRSAEKNYADSQKRYHADSQKRYYTPTHKRGTVLRRLTKEVVLARVGPGGESARESHRRVLRGQTPGQSATRPSLQAAGQVAPCCVRQPPWSRSPRHS